MVIAKMNKERRKILCKAFEELEGVVQEERETLDNQEESFGQTERWQTSDENCSEGENVIEELRSVLETWGAL